MNKTQIINLITITGIIITTVLVIFFSQGWRFDINDRTIINTGVLDITSDPKNAIIYIDGEEKGKSPTVIDSLKPQTYLVELRLEGYTEWKKEIKITAQTATKIEANLFNNDTQLEQLSDIPLEQVIFSPQGNQAIVVSKKNGNQGIWLVQLKTSFFTFNNTKKKIGNLYESELFDLLKSDYEINVSPDFSKLILTVRPQGDSAISPEYFLISLSTPTINKITEWIPQDSTFEWNDNGDYIVVNKGTTLASLNVNTLQKSIITHDGNAQWATIKDNIYFSLNNTAGIYTAQLDGTARKKLSVIDSIANNIQAIKSNPIQEHLILVTDKTFILDLTNNQNTELISDHPLVFISNSPNSRFSLFYTDATDDQPGKDIYSYDYEFPALTQILNGYDLPLKNLNWSPNDLKLFYRATNDKNENITMAVDSNGGNLSEILNLENYTYQLDNKIGFSSDAKELYLPLAASKINQNTITESNPEGETEDELMLYKLQLR